jgi:hypothetical protein
MKTTTWKTIWKFPIQVQDQVIVDMPHGAALMCVQVQNGVPCLWALVDPDQPLKARRFRVYGTGHPLDPDGVEFYVGTFQISEGSLVFHVFEAGTNG